MKFYKTVSSSSGQALFSFILLFIFSSTVFAQSIYTRQDVDICKSKFNLAVDKDLAKKPINEIIIEIAKSFIGTDYAAATLEKGEKESLVINLAGLDCYTLLENSFVIARCIKNGKTLFEDYQKELTNIRYRNGNMRRYPSRLHYFSDWIYDMQKRGIAKDVTKEIGGTSYKKKINFMSKHVNSYKQLKANSKFVKEIEFIEKEISARRYFYVPEDSIALVESKIMSGDLLALTTDIEGLDVSHVGIAIKMDDGRIHLLHSPTVGSKVQVTEKPLADYVIANKKQTGIMVVRAN
jgi:hypothetical protein